MSKDLLVRIYCVLSLVRFISLTNSTMSFISPTTNRTVEVVNVPTTEYRKGKNNTSTKTHGDNSNTTYFQANGDNTTSSSPSNKKEVTQEEFYKYKKHACKALNITNCTCEKLNKIIFDPSHDECLKPTLKTAGSSSFEPYTCIKTLSKTAYVGVILCISIVGIVGNLMVLLVRVHNWKKSLHYQLISGLAAADFCFSVIHVAVKLPDIWSCQWLYGLAFCKIFKSFLILSSSIDLGFILIIAIERYIGIVHPFTGGASANKTYVMIGVNVVLSLVMSILPMLIHTLDNTGRCSENWAQYENGSLIYGWCTNVFFFFIPIIVTGFLYYQSLSTLKSTLFRQEMLLTLDEHSRKKLVHENKRILRIISTILIAFFVLVGPNHIMWLLVDNMGQGFIPKATRKLLFLISSATYSLHATVNPIIYSIIDRKFRRNVLYIIRHRKRRKSYHTIVTALNWTPVHQVQQNFELQETPNATTQEQHESSESTRGE